MNSKDDTGAAASDARDAEAPADPPGATTRRGVLIATGAAVFGGALGGVLGYAAGRNPGTVPSVTTDSDAGAAASGAASGPGADAGASSASTALARAERQSGITWPEVPPRHTFVAVYDLPGRSAGQILDTANAVRDVANAAASEAAAEAAGVAASATVLVGLGIPAAHELFPERCQRSEGLPGFDSDTPEMIRGGELMVMIAAETLAEVQQLTASAQTALGEHRMLWSTSGFRDEPTPQGTTLGGIGFIDGIVNPRTAAELRAGVWVGEHRRDTFFVVRRMPIRASFGALPVAEQEAAVGRRKRDGVPLSGGDPMGDIDLLAKYPDGRTKVPAAAHARRSHPANIGRPLMLRRSYTFNEAEESGLLFVAALSDAETFVLTQRRMDESDALLSHASTTAGDCFFVPEELSAV